MLTLGNFSSTKRSQHNSYSTFNQSQISKLKFGNRVLKNFCVLNEKHGVLGIYL